MIWLGSFAVQAEPRFIDGLGDVPLMPLLEVDETASMIFDSPNGRIADITVKGSATQQAILAFYGAALPQMGWRATDQQGRFLREGEVLTLEFSPADMSQLEVRFRLVPVP